MDYLLSYGSLLNRYSRESHSEIFGEVFPAVVKGWTRSWCARYPDEAATYAGAYSKPGGFLNAIVVPTVITEELRIRERHYRFVELDRSDFDLIDASPIHLNNEDRFWICEILNFEAANKANPLPQSYVDTCIAGCLETNNYEFVFNFVEQTLGWEDYWVNDRDLATPIFPRCAPTTHDELETIDSILEKCNVLHYRHELA